MALHEGYFDGLLQMKKTYVRIVRNSSSLFHCQYLIRFNNVAGSPTIQKIYFIRSLRFNNVAGYDHKLIPYNAFVNTYTFRISLYKSSSILSNYNLNYQRFVFVLHGCNLPSGFLENPIEHLRK